jgi:hypothetical protein
MSLKRAPAETVKSVDLRKVRIDTNLMPSQPSHRIATVHAHRSRMKAEIVIVIVNVNGDERGVNQRPHQNRHMSAQRSRHSADSASQDRIFLVSAKVWVNDPFLPISQQRGVAKNTNNRD